MQLTEGNMKNKVVIIATILIIAFTSMLLLGYVFFKTHFDVHTRINGIDCSFSTVEQAQKKINRQIAAKEILIKFAGKKEYKITGKDIGLCIENKKELEDIRNNKNIKELFYKKEYTLEKSFSLNEGKLMNYLKSLPEWQEEVILPKNAFLSFNKKSNTIEMIPEVVGNVKTVEEAFKIAKNTLQSGETVINFAVYPEIISSNKELIETKEKMNQILKTTIHYQLKNGKTVTLDWSNWIKEDKQGKWKVDIENNLKDFVNSLDKKVKAVSWKCTFKATGIGNITLPLRNSLKERVNTEEETKRIRQLLGTGKTYRLEPIYTKSTYQDALSNYLEVDLTRQKVWLYRNGKCIVSGNCVSGNVSGGHSTPTGMFYLDNKLTNTYLKGLNNDGSKYSSFVNFWMPFNGGVGLHDATWRTHFGGNIYKYNGSHGCINLPYSVAKKIYENINYKTLIIVYKS